MKGWILRVSDIRPPKKGELYFMDKDHLDDPNYKFGMRILLALNNHTLPSRICSAEPIADSVDQKILEFLEWQTEEWFLEYSWELSKDFKNFVLSKMLNAE